VDLSASLNSPLFDLGDKIFQSSSGIDLSSILGVVSGTRSELIDESDGVFHSELSIQETDGLLVDFSERP